MAKQWQEIVLKRTFRPVANFERHPLHCASLETETRFSLVGQRIKKTFKHESNLFSEKQRDADEMTAVIAKLEKSINSYKEEYAQLISQAEAIKNILKDVQGKVRIS